MNPEVETHDKIVKNNAKRLLDMFKANGNKCLHCGSKEHHMCYISSICKANTRK